MIKFIGKIPIKNFIYYISYERQYTKEMAIEYVKKIYNIDISKEVEVEEYKYWWKDYNIYDKYNKEYPLLFKDNKTREFYNTYSKRRFYDFYNKYLDEGFYDQISIINKADNIHHIFPLVYGGDNSLKNLIAVTEYNHELLHMNPLENIEKYNYQAVDYLYFLYHEGMFNIIKKYKIHKEKTNRSLLKYQYLELELKYFYEEIVKEYNSNKNKAC